MEDKALRMTLLYDFFGELLTEKQREYFDLYYNEDLSLSEIAENEGISRQGVRDNIVRAENILTETEAKTGIVQRFLRSQAAAEQILNCASEILSLNEDFIHDERLAALANRIYESSKSLKDQ